MHVWRSTEVCLVRFVVFACVGIRNSDALTKRKIICLVTAVVAATAAAYGKNVNEKLFVCGHRLRACV